MSNAPSDQSTSTSKARAKNWPLWLGVGFFGAVGLALAVSLTNFMREDTTSPTAVAPAETEAPADLREHQQLVNAVVNDLDREILIGNSFTKGNPDADIVMLKFSDFQCAYCAQATGEIDAFMAEHGDDVLFAYKHFPLTNIHPEAVPAALASWAAGQQGEFWAFHDALFANQVDLGDDLYVRIAGDLDLDIEQFNRDRASEDAKKAVAQDMALAQEMQLRSTPTFIMDNLLIPGAMPADFLAEALTRLQAAKESAE